MKSPRSFLLLALASSLLFLVLESGTAKPGGIYRGSAKMAKTIPDGGEAMPFPNAMIKLRLPNRKGGLGGTLFTEKAGKTGDTSITGKVKKHLERQGGKKHTYIGNWTWDLFAADLPGKAKSPFNFTVKKSGKGYKISPAERIKLDGKGTPNFTFKAKVNAKK